jgi:hypothetical protein
MRSPHETSLRRGAKFLLLAQLAGGSLFVASCGAQIRQAVLTGVTQFVYGSTSQFVTDAFGIEEVLRNLLTADNDAPNTSPIN